MNRVQSSEVPGKMEKSGPPVSGIIYGIAGMIQDPIHAT